MIKLIPTSGDSRTVSRKVIQCSLYCKECMEQNPTVNEIKVPMTGHILDIVISWMENHPDAKAPEVPLLSADMKKVCDPNVANFIDSLHANGGNKDLYDTVSAANHLGITISSRLAALKLHH